jgi:hypothetical protein
VSQAKVFFSLVIVFISSLFHGMNLHPFIIANYTIRLRLIVQPQRLPTNHRSPVVNRTMANLDHLDAIGFVTFVNSILIMC